MKAFFRKIFDRFSDKSPCDITLQNLCNFIPTNILSTLDSAPTIYNMQNLHLSNMGGGI